MQKSTDLSEIKQSKILKIIGILTNIIQSSPHDANNLGFINGLSGELLFLCQANKFDKSLVNETAFDNKVQFFQEHLHKTATQFDFSHGISGAGWSLEYLNQAQGEDYDPELCEDIDDILLKSTSVENWQAEIEMLLGLGGIAIYAARRQLKADTTVLFHQILHHYENLSSQISEDTLTWRQPDNSRYRLNREDTKQAEYNLGLAHGVPGIIAAILPALQIPQLKTRTERLLRQSCDWLLQQQLNTPDQQSYFSLSTTQTRCSRLAWCYGDLTIALTLARVGKSLKIPSYINKAKEISLHAALRNEKNGKVYDAGLCHGSAGIALIFQILYKELKLVELYSAAQRWLDFTLELYDKNDNPIIKFNGCYGSSAANLLGRFCHLHNDLQKKVTEHLIKEEQHSSDVIFAEIVHMPEGPSW